MAGIGGQVKELKHLKQLVKKGVKVVGKIFKKGWQKVKSIRR